MGAINKLWIESNSTSRRIQYKWNSAGEWEELPLESELKACCEEGKIQELLPSIIEIVDRFYNSNEKSILEIWFSGTNGEFEYLESFVENYYSDKNRTEVKPRVIKVDDFSFQTKKPLNSYAQPEQSNVETVVGEDEYVDEFISSILHIPVGTKKVYQYKNIHISAYINCEGDLTFDHCVLYYNESDAADEITLGEGSKLLIKNSVVICKGLDKTPFLSGKGSNAIVFSETRFENCGYFLKEYDCSKFEMKFCKLINCYEQFISISFKYGAKDNACTISNNEICQNSIADFYAGHFWLNPDIDIIKVNARGTVGIFCENKIQESNIFSGAKDDKKISKRGIMYLTSNCLRITDCSFWGMTGGINVVNVTDCKFVLCDGCIKDMPIVCEGKFERIIENCIFEDCTNVLILEDDAKVYNCKFISCYNRIILHDGWKGGVSIELCQFTDAFYKDLKEGVFARAYWGEACISFRRSKGIDSKINKIEKCIFDGVCIRNGFLIASRDGEKPLDTVTKVEGCDFRNCVTTSMDGKIINENMTYLNLFKKAKVFHAIVVSNCKGLDKVMKNK